MTARLSAKEKARRKREREMPVVISGPDPTIAAHRVLHAAGWKWIQNEWVKPQPIEATTATEILAKAAEHQAARAATYDSPGGERSMERTVQVFNLVTRRDIATDRPLTESEGWQFMQLLKDVRDRATKKPHRDSLEDKVSYASLQAEARLREGA